VTAWTGVHGCHHHEAGGKCGGAEGTRDGDRALLERLAQDFQAAAVELGQLIEEQHAVMCQRYFARRRRAAAADHASIRDRVMRRPKGSCGQERLIGLETAQGAVDARCLQALG
jgi:hypothetical protein